MNENPTNTAAVEEEQQLEFVAVPAARKKRSEDPLGQIIAALSALMLLFSVILVVAIALINAEVTPKPNQNTNLPIISSDLLLNAEASTKYRPAYISNPLSIKGISSEAALLVKYEGNDFTTGTAIAIKNPDSEVYIASMTKVMTLIVVCDYITDESMLRETVTLNYLPSKLAGYSNAFVKDTHRSETVYIIDAMYGLILRSGADCAYGLADKLAGSEAAFVAKMNEKAAALGMTKTTFTNCVGKHDGQNISSVRDVATMFAYALENEFCRQILSAESWNCAGSYKTSRLISLVHDTLKSKLNQTLVCGEVTIVGGKSGSENDGSKNYYCLVTLAKASDGTCYVCVTAEGNNSYNDTIAVYKNSISE